MKLHEVGCWKVTLTALVVACSLSGTANAQRVLAEGVKDLSEQIATKAKEQQKLRIAVLPFRELDGQPTVLGTFLAEELFTHLVNAGLEIIERSLLDKLLVEIKLDQTGVIDAETAKQVGKVIGVDAVVTGSIAELNSYVAINCRLIDASTGKTFAAALTKILKDADVESLMKLATPKPVPPARARDGLDDASAGGGRQDAEQPASGMTRLEEDFRFELKACVVSGTSVLCDLLVTNQGADRELAFYASEALFNYPRIPGSRLFDSEGNEIEAAELSLGNQTAVGKWHKTSVLASGVPTRSRVRFEGVGTGISRAALVEVLYSGRAYIRVQFRDVPLGRR